MLELGHVSRAVYRAGTGESSLDPAFEGSILGLQLLEFADREFNRTSGGSLGMKVRVIVSSVKDSSVVTNASCVASHGQGCLGQKRNGDQRHRCLDA